MEGKTIGKSVEKKISDAVRDFMDTLEIDSEGYPHKPYIVADLIDVGKWFMALFDEITTMIGNERKLSDIFAPMTISEIESSITLDNYLNFDELEEVDSFNDADSELKYIYHTIIFKYIPDGAFYSVTIQRSGDEELSLRWGGKVEKKEIVTVRWV